MESLQFSFHPQGRLGAAKNATNEKEGCRIKHVSSPCCFAIAGPFPLPGTANRTEIIPQRSPRRARGAAVQRLSLHELKSHSHFERVRTALPTSVSSTFDGSNAGSSVNTASAKTSKFRVRAAARKSRLGLDDHKCEVRYARSSI